MAQRGRSSVLLSIKGTNRKDPLPTLLRKQASLATRKQELYNIVNRAGQPMAEKMRKDSPVGRTGALSASFRVRRSTRKRKFTEVSVFVGGIKSGTVMTANGPAKMQGWRAHWAELGTVNHAGAYFLQPAIRWGIPVAQERIRKGLSTLVRRLRRRGKLKG